MATLVVYPTSSPAILLPLGDIGKRVEALGTRLFFPSPMIAIAKRIIVTLVFVPPVIMRRELIALYVCVSYLF